MDGNYSDSLFNERLNACDTVFFLDYSVDTCLSGVRQRWGKRNDLICPGLKSKKIKSL